MNYKISKEEFIVLTFLHDSAEAYDDPSSGFNIEDVAKETGLDLKDVKKASSFLSSLNLAGVSHDPHGLTFANENDRYLYLTGHGEHLMRELDEELVDQIESEPGKAKKITLKIAGVLYDAGKAVIVKVLTDLATGHH